MKYKRADAVVRYTACAVILAGVLWLIAAVAALAAKVNNPQLWDWIVSLRVVFLVGACAVLVFFACRKPADSRPTVQSEAASD